jgi:3-(3-hydroxy-phenyl)propionate hydroxylase
MERVLVVGAGPVGLTAALALAREGVRVDVFEKRAALNLASKGSTFHPPTLEMLDELGVAQRLLAQGERAARIDYYEGEHRVARLEMALIAGLTRHSRTPRRGAGLARRATAARVDRRL